MTFQWDTKDKVALLDYAEDAVTGASESMGDAALAVGPDVSPTESADPAIAQVKETFGRIDAVVNCVSISRPKSRTSIGTRWWPSTSRVPCARATTR